MLWTIYQFVRAVVRQGLQSKPWGIRPTSPLVMPLLMVINTVPYRDNGEMVV